MAKKIAPADLRRDYVHAHALALHALGITGNSLIASEPTGWRLRITKLGDIDWLRSNAEVWEGRAMIGGHISKAHANVVLTASYLKRVLDLPLTAEERRLESGTERKALVP
jgi:DNA sulfur modification protein DndB